METAVKVVIITGILGITGIITGILLRQFLSIRSKKPAAAASLIRKIELTIPFDWEKALNKNTILMLEDVAAFKEQLWFWEVRKLDTLWFEYEKYQHTFDQQNRLLALRQLLAFTKKHA